MLVYFVIDPQKCKMSESSNFGEGREEIFYVGLHNFTF